MATGTVKWFSRALLDLGEKIHDLSSDSFKLGIVTTSTVPAVSTADPRWGAGGTTNFSSTQVATGTAYTGPIALSGVTWTEVSNVPTFRATNVTIAQDAGGFTDGAWGIVYNDTAAGKQCIGFIELSSGGTLSLVAGSVTIDWAGANGDVLTLTQS